MPHRFLGILFLASILGSTAACQPIGPADIPQVKPDGWVVDLAGLLSPAEVAELERLGEAAHGRNGAALAVLTVQSTGGLDPRTLATSVFNRWQLGDKRRNNGLLIFVAIDDRAAEIVLGDGIDSDAEVAKSDQIMQNMMVPRFRRMEPNLSILLGARACAAQFFGVGRPELEALPLVLSAPSSRPWRAPYPGVSIALAVLALLGAAFSWAKWRRNRPRSCRQCQTPMVRLDEVWDDDFLEPGELVEEKLDTINYDVWRCPECGSFEKLPYRNRFNAYHRCPQCKRLAARKVRTVLTHATYTEAGLEKIQEKCQHCDCEVSSTEKIPVKRRESSSSGRSFSSSSSSSSGGGGSSSGRGSSGRW